MKEHEVIIIGGGPSGSTCAWKLKQKGVDVLILEKQSFPRVKLCAGWITSKVMDDLQFTAEEYPHTMTSLDVRMHIAPLRIGLPWFPTRWDNYSIRRVEFDQWLLKRSGAAVENHSVKSIRQENGRYIIDDKYSCKYLIGAGGTQCPVRRNLFAKSRIKSNQLATLELEFEYPYTDKRCHLFFFYRGLRGYSWYVPKGDGVINIGIGGISSYFKKADNNIHQHFKCFIEDLVKQKLLDQATADKLKVTGHPYFLHSFEGEFKQDNCFLIGDSAGLASMDMGEGIGPAIESGLMAAGEILAEDVYTKTKISRFSFGGPLYWVLDRLVYPQPG